MNIGKIFTESAQGFAPEHIELNYLVAYQSGQGESYIVETKALWKAYDFRDTFFLPRFDMSSEAILTDYHLLARMPYNSAFWEGQKAFAMKQSDNANERFMRDSASLNSFNIWEPNQYQKKGFFEVAYIPWSMSSRIQFGPHSVTETDMPSWTPIWKNYKLSAGIYFDLIEQHDSLEVLSRCLWDPYNTYYPFEMTPEALAFINIYFDLIEIHRRDLHYKVKTIKNNRIAVNAAYNTFLEEWGNLERKYISEVDRGRDRDGLLKWNEKVKEAIGVDNVALFLQK